MTHIEYNPVFSKKILSWHHNAKIDHLPWQINKTIYKIWISEIMLQQTQVNTVIPYYNNFIKNFPTIFKLAQSELNAILHAWSGLGYYKRAINLHKTAKIIINYYHGEFPQDFNILLTLPGIGKSTAGAILSLALNKRYPILDSNIKRILMRYYNVNYHSSQNTKINNNLWSLINQLIPFNNKCIAHFNQAMMNLGRLICTPTHPRCTVCPIHNDCQSFLSNNIDLYSKKTTSKNTIKLIKTLWWIIILNQHTNMVYLKKRTKEKIWNELFCFPEFYDIHILNLWLIKHNIHNKPQENMTMINTYVSNINLKIQPILIKIDNIWPINTKKNKIWYNLYAPEIIGLPTSVGEILQKLKNIN